LQIGAHFRGKRTPIAPFVDLNQCRDGGRAQLLGVFLICLEKIMKTRWLAIAVCALLIPVAASAQGVVGGAQEGASKGAREGNRAAGPVGGAVGTVVGGTAGAVTGGGKGALGVSDKPKKKKTTNN
jgi:hypothetical protein